jgi:hypothetical protein
MCELCRGASGALRVSFGLKTIHAVLALRATELKGEP